MNHGAGTELKREELVQLANFRHAVRVFLREAEANAHAEGITGQQYQLLLCVGGNASRDWITVSEAAESLLIAPHAAVGLINRCEQAGWVERCTAPDDRRRVEVRLTVEGQAKLQAVAARNHGERARLWEAIQPAGPAIAPKNNR